MFYFLFLMSISLNVSTFYLVCPEPNEEPVIIILKLYCLFHFISYALMELNND